MVSQCSAVLRKKCRYTFVHVQYDDDDMMMVDTMMATIKQRPKTKQVEVQSESLVSRGIAHDNQKNIFRKIEPTPSLSL